MSADTAAFAPIDAPRRILALDAIRGFALLGIFLMNVEWFSRPMQELGSGIAPGATGLAHAGAWLVSVFVPGKVDRKGGGEGKSVSVREEPGGRRRIKKK